MPDETSVEELKLRVNLPDFSMRVVSIPKLSRVLRRKGYDIDVVREGQRIDIPLPALKENFTVLLDPLEHWVSIEAETLDDAIDGWNSIFQIFKRDFRVFRISKCILDTSLRIKCRGDKAADIISIITSPVKDKLNFDELVGEETKIVGFKVATPGLTIIVDEWNVDMSYYVIRVVKTSEGVEEVSEFNFEEVALSLVSRMEEMYERRNI